MEFIEIVAIILGSMLIVGFFVMLFVLNHFEEKLKKQDKSYKSPQNDITDIDNYEPQEMHIRAKIVDMACRSRLVGTREPKSVQEYLVVFLDEYEKRHDIFVNEDYYNALEVDQVGILTLVDGDFYSFELDD